MTTHQMLSHANAVAASLFRRMKLRADGSVIDDNAPDTDVWTEADATDDELVSVGGGTFEITAVGDGALATAVGATDEAGDPLPCLKAIYTPHAGIDERPVMGDLLSIETPDGSMSLVFSVAFTHADLMDHLNFDLGPDAYTPEPLAALQPGEVVLVLVPEFNQEAE